jgi:LDH2 family malate/lactate/ureidoglycolate dehydrogenase
MNLNRRNYPPDHGIRVPAESIRSLLVALFQAVGMPDENAELLSGILSANTVRCNYSHGIGHVPYYLRKIEEGRVNPAPNITDVSESAGSLVLDGDGGLGYFPCWYGTQRIIEKARSCGIAALTTANHQHFGAAGIYTRLAVDHDCIGWSASSHRRHLSPDDPIFGVVDTSPTSFGFPTGDQPPLIADMGGEFIRYSEELFAQVPTTFLKVMALTSAVRSLGSILPGIYRQEIVDSKWEANQGAFIAVIDVAHFLPIDEFKADLDRFISEARSMRPLPGMDRAELAGGNEWASAKDNEVHGVPLSDDHCAALQAEADRYGIETPFALFEGSRFTTRAAPRRGGRGWIGAIRRLRWPRRDS